MEVGRLEKMSGRCDEGGEGEESDCVWIQADPIAHGHGQNACSTYWT